MTGVVKVSVEDWDWVRGFDNWYLHDWPPYCARRTLNPDPPPRYRTLLLHRLIAIRMGFLGSEEVDHRNRDTLDDRRENLRPVTRQENSRNRKKPRGRPRELEAPPVKVCEQCGREYTPRRRAYAYAKSRFCSRDCQRFNALGYEPAHPRST